MSVARLACGAPAISATAPASGPRTAPVSSAPPRCPARRGCPAPGRPPAAPPRAAGGGAPPAGRAAQGGGGGPHGDRRRGVPAGGQRAEQAAEEQQRQAEGEQPREGP